MRRTSSWWLVPALLLSTGCNPGGNRAANTPGRDTTDTAARSANSVAIVTVLYNAPQDTAAFERYYRETHVPLVVANQKEIGFFRADLTRFSSTVNGRKPTFYRQAELYFQSLDDLKQGIATAGFKKVAEDLPKFATGGFTAMVAAVSNRHEPGTGEAPAAIVTVIYNAPKDAATFERYYTETHLPLVKANQEKIGFERRELTKFSANLDGSRPARYRQAELYFPTIEALRKGIATPEFKRVADDLGNFATGGFDALIGVETR
jgi:uncharacterized protein (TIGR02118 family)